jgi:PIN domain nuclease of toxin-antitoxin system
VRVLLDTHVLLWWLLGNPRLSSTASAVLGDIESTILVSAISGHEIATKFRLGKLAVPARLAEGLDQIVAENGWRPLPLSIALGQLAGRLPGTHKDPFDRMLAAQALIEDVQMVTNDPAMEGFRVKLVW